MNIKYLLIFFYNLNSISEKIVIKDSYTELKNNLLENNSKKFLKSLKKYYKSELTSCILTIGMSNIFIKKKYVLLRLILLKAFYKRSYIYKIGYFFVRSRFSNLFKIVAEFFIDKKVKVIISEMENFNNISVNLLNILSDLSFNLNKYDIDEIILKHRQIIILIEEYNNNGEWILREMSRLKLS